MLLNEIFRTMAGAVELPERGLAEGADADVVEVPSAAGFSRGGLGPDPIWIGPVTSCRIRFENEMF